MKSVITLNPILSEANEPKATILAPVMLDSTGGRYAKSPEIKQELVSIFNALDTIKSRLAALEGKLIRIVPKVTDLTLNLADLVSAYLSTDSSGRLLSFGLSETIRVLANGANQDIDPGGGSYLRLSGPVAGFSLGGFQAPSVAQLLMVYNSTSQQMTINNADGGSSAANRILTLTGGNVVLRAGTSAATLIYSLQDQRWILLSTN